MYPWDRRIFELVLFLAANDSVQPPPFFIFGRDAKRIGANLDRDNRNMMLILREFLLLLSFCNISLLYVSYIKKYYIFGKIYGYFFSFFLQNIAMILFVFLSLYKIL